ncbi:MAG: NAD(P)/FAD-dependent oxidoreductase [Candidatus Helarchaeota archaeon]
MTVKSILIVGAGPAGASCAGFLAKKGFQVILLEKEKIPRYKACGGAIPLEMIKEFKIPAEIIQRNFTSLILHHVSKNVTLARKGEGAVLWRSDLDAFLTDRAVENGADLIDNTPVIGIKRVNNQYKVQTSKDSYETDWIVAADGVNSTVLHKSGWKKFSRTELALTITHEIQLSPKIIEDRLGEDKLHIYFGKNFFGTGYGWLFPKKTIVSVGWGCRFTDIKNSSRQFQEFLDLIHVKIKGGKLIKKAAHLVPVGVRTLYHNQIIATGDAAGLVDPLSGKGIIYAAWSGLIAGQVLRKILETGENDQFKEMYEKKLNSAFLNALKAKRKIQPDVYRTDENILRFMRLWQNHRSTEIALSLWRNR